MRTNMLKFGAVVVTIFVLQTSFLGIAMASNIGSEMSKYSHDTVPGGPEQTAEYQEMPDIVFDTGEMTLTICILKTGRHVLIVFETDKQRSTIEYVVAKESKGYNTRIFLNERLFYQNTVENNILDPIPLTGSGAMTQIASQEGGSRLTPDYTYEWWDGVKQVTGPSWQIKYHHPDRDYYQIATFNDWTKNGFQTSHNQINDELSATLSSAGWAIIFATIAAYAAAGAGPWASAGAALLAGVFGAVFGYVTGAILKDEEGCIWWWWGNEFANWFMDNIIFLVTNPLGWGATIGALLAIGYLRIGDWTFVDGPGIGNP